MNARSILLTAGALVLAGCGRSSTAAEEDSIVGKWSRDGYAYEHLTFMPDGGYTNNRFELRGSTRDTVRSVRTEGEYRLEGDTLQLRPLRESVRDADHPDYNADYSVGGYWLDAGTFVLDRDHLTVTGLPSDNLSDHPDYATYTRIRR